MPNLRLTSFYLGHLRRIRLMITLPNQPVLQQHNFQREVIGIKRRFFELRLELLKSLSRKKNSFDRTEYIAVCLLMQDKRQENPALFDLCTHKHV